MNAPAMPLLLPLLLGAACSTAAPALRLRPGTTTRTECLFALGMPAMAMAGGSTLVYLTAPGEACSTLVANVLHARRAAVPRTGESRFAEFVLDPVHDALTEVKPCATVVLRFDSRGVLQRATVVAPQ